MFASRGESKPLAPPVMSHPCKSRFMVESRKTSVCSAVRAEKMKWQLETPSKVLPVENLMALVSLDITMAKMVKLSVTKARDAMKQTIEEPKSLQVKLCGEGDEWAREVMTYYLTETEGASKIEGLKVNDLVEGACTTAGVSLLNEVAAGAAKNNPKLAAAKKTVGTAAAFLDKTGFFKGAIA